MTTPRHCDTRTSLLAFLYGTATLVLVLLLAGCDMTGQPAQHEADPPKARLAQRETASGARAASKITHVNVLLDLSGGMLGFVHANAPGEAGSEFQQSIATLLSDVQALAGHGIQPHYYFIKQAPKAGASVFVPSTYREMRDVVSQGTKKNASGTEMPEMLRQAVKLQAEQPGTVNLIISDFVYGPEDQRTVWRVRTDVKDALSAADPQQLAMSVYAGQSAFRGIFYPGTRHKPQTLKGVSVPYYVWAMAAPRVLAIAEQKVLSRLADRPQAHFNRAPITPTAEALPGYQAKGLWFPGLNSEKSAPVVVVSELTSDAPVQFVIGLDLRQLPRTEQAQSAKAANLVLDAGSTDAQVVRVWTADAPEVAKLSAQKRGQYSHFAQISLTKMGGAGEATMLALRLPASGTNLPDWVQAYSTESDDNLANQGAKTFRLTEILRGVGEAFAPTTHSTDAAVWQTPIQVRLDD